MKTRHSCPSLLVDRLGWVGASVKGRIGPAEEDEDESNPLGWAVEEDVEKI